MSKYEKRPRAVSNLEKSPGSKKSQSQLVLQRKQSENQQYFKMPNDESKGEDEEFEMHSKVQSTRN
jgi:hypothetical protein